MQYKIIVATCKNNGIGYCNALPWSIREDLRHFSKLTKGNGNNAIIMGKKTWKSIGSKPLPNRDHFILSTTMHDDDLTIPSTTNNQTFLCKHIDEVDLKCRENKYENVWIIGGESIYKQFLERNCVTECILTFIDHDFECDTFFPSLSSTIWKLINIKTLENKHNYNVTICHYKII